MFLEKYIHNPDSPRQLNPMAWLATNEIVVANEYKKTISNERVNIDVRDLSEQIAEGLLYVEQTNDRIRVVYKLEAGLYTQTDFNGRTTYEIPLPDLYIVYYGAYGKTRNGDTYLGSNKVWVGSKYADLLPLTNLYSNFQNPSGFEDYVNGIRWFKVCAESVIPQMVGEAQTMTNIINTMVNVFTMFLFSHSNLDLELSDETTKSAYRIARQITRDSNRKQRYQNYWRFLKYHYDQIGNAEEVYARLTQSYDEMIRQYKNK